MRSYMLTVIGAALLAALLTVGLALLLAPGLIGGTAVGWPLAAVLVVTMLAAVLVRRRG